MPNAGSSDEEQMETNLEAILDDEINQYNTQKEQALIKRKPKSKKGRPQNDSDEEQVKLK